MCAEILAIGPYSPDLIEHLEYGPEFYESVEPGATITEVLFGILEGSSLSREFAALLGVTDPWDFNQHHLDASKFNIKGLERFVETYDDYADGLRALLAFLDHGFQFHFRPNG